MSASAGSPRGNRALLSAGAIAPGVIMLASFTPTPLYPDYQELFDIGSGGVSLIFAGYPAGVVFCLTLLGGLSDVVGRRRTILFGGTVLIAGLMLLSVAPSLAVMVVGRFVQGLGVALVSTAAASALMELHPKGVEAGSQFNTASVSLGVAFGPLVAGLVADQMPYPLRSPYWVVALMVLVPMVLAAFSPRTPRTPGAQLVRRVRVPRELARPFVASAAAVAITNLCTGLMGAFSPEVARSVGWQGSTLNGVFVSVLLFSIAVAQMAGGSWPPRRAMVGGGMVAVTGWALLALGSFVGSPVLALAAVVVLGAGTGATLLGSAAAMSLWAPPERRAELYAAWLLVPFTTLGLSAFLAAPLVASTSVAFALLGAGVLTVGLTALVRHTAART